MKEHEDTNADATTRAERGLLMLRAGGLTFAVYADECECVTPWAEPAPLPHAPAPVLGVASVRGRMRTVLDPAQLFETARTPAGGQRPGGRALIASLRGDEQLALAVETSHASALSAGEELAAPATPLHAARATFERGGETVYLLDPSRLFDAAMRGTERRRYRAVSREP